MISFSVITVVLNDLEGIKETYLSLVGQSDANYEWIVKDGGSSDGTLEFLEGLPGDFKLIGGKDFGIYDAMNQCVEDAVNDFVVFMNAGDIFYNKDVLLDVSTSILNGDQAVDILFGGAILRFPNTQNNIYRPPKRSESYIWHGLPANQQATYYRRSLLGATPYDLKYSLCGDYFLAVAFIKLGAIEKYLDKPLAIFETGGQSYKNLRKLFSQPYQIQRDLLGLPRRKRIRSFIKRLMSTVGFIIFSQKLFKNLTK
jgi:putative colanic acid biosynthesis glycosyltransferase